MIEFSVTILGSSSATPTSKRNPSAQLVRHRQNLFLVDCGEGAQVSIRRQKIHFQKIEHIFISHLHGDHFYGLIGLISSMHLLGRQAELHIYGPPELKDVIELQLKVSDTALVYPLVFHFTQVDHPEILFENEYITVTSFPLLHRIPTTGFLFREKPGERKIRKEKMGLYDLSFDDIHRLKQGKDIVTAEGLAVSNEEMTLAPPPARTYAYCSDTAYFEDIIPVVQDVDLLYHETTFMNDKLASAKEKFHSTTLEAATLARKAGVKKLLIGHFSARYDDVSLLEAEARTLFPESYVAEEGKIFYI